MSATLRIGGGGGFWGDTEHGAVQLVERGGIDVLIMDYLAEITMSLLARARARQPKAGFAPDFVALMGRLAPTLAEKKIRVVVNAGGVNPLGCREAVEAALKEAGVDLRVAVVTGDDLMPIADELRQSGSTEMFSGAPLPDDLWSMNAYLGAFPIAAALEAGADIVITGRCTDSALALGPLIHAFGWAGDDYDRLAMGSLVGHILECGTQATGGITTDWQDVPGWDDMGFPDRRMPRRRLVHAVQARSDRRSHQPADRRRAGRLRNRRSAPLHPARRGVRFQQCRHRGRRPRSREDHRRARRTADIDLQGQRDLRRRLQGDRHDDDRWPRCRRQGTPDGRGDPCAQPQAHDGTQSRRLPPHLDRGARRGGHLRRACAHGRLARGDPQARRASRRQGCLRDLLARVPAERDRDGAGHHRFRCRAAEGRAAGAAAFAAGRQGEGDAARFDRRSDLRGEGPGAAGDDTAGGRSGRSKASASARRTRSPRSR